ncbi:MAG: hypothetical protein NXI13_05345 [Proteobacteria bacterium]|nr:hypothetical protein [Pseudomonadota bacterium]
MTIERNFKEIHDLTGNVAQHYIEKYGKEAVPVLEQAAQVFEDNNDIRGRNRILRLRDEILIAQFGTG